MRESGTGSRVLVLICVLAVAFVYVWGLGAVGFRDPDEGMYAEIAREMLASGDWIVPRFNGVPYVEKPPLMYWLTAATFAVAGPSESSARIWKVLPMLGSICLTYLLGRRLFSRRVGSLSALIQATTLGSFLFSRIAEMDPLLLFGITLSAYGIVLAAAPEWSSARVGHRRAGLWFWLGIGIAVMSKGLLGFMLPVALLVLWGLVRRDGAVIGRVWSWGGIIAALVLVVPWHVAAAIKVPGFVQFYLLDNQILRFFGERAYVEDGRSLGTVAFLGITIYAMFPWAHYLGGALSTILQAAPGASAPDRHARLRDPRLRFLLGWLLLVLGVFALSSFKLEYYALPALPAAALLVAAFIHDAEVQEKSGRTATPSPTPGARPERCWPLRLLRIWSWVALLGGLLFMGGVAWAWWAGQFTPPNIIRALSIWATNYRIILDQGLPLPSVSPGYFQTILLGGGAIWVGGFACALYWLRRDQVMAATWAVALVGLGLAMLAGSILREIDPHYSLKPLAARLNRLIRAEDVLVHERGLEKGGGLLFYTRRKVLILNGTRGDLEFGSRLPEFRQVFIDTPAFRDLWNSGRRVFLVTDLPLPQSALAHITGAAPVLIASTGTRWLYSNRPPVSSASATGSWSSHGIPS